MDLENKRRSYFNPRSYKRSDYYRPVPGDPVDEFQSTLLQEERRNHIRKDFPEVFISIHAPTRGATAGFFSSDRTIAHFNPRSYKRSDPVPPAVSALPCYFNPRSYKRSDRGTENAATDYMISIHAPTRGATTRSPTLIPFIEISIHAPTRGATVSQQIDTSTPYDFNPRSYKRSDLYLFCTCSKRLLFQSTLLQEERLLHSWQLGMKESFQSTLLQEERQQKCTIFLMHLCNNYCIVSI